MPIIKNDDLRVGIPFSETRCEIVSDHLQFHALRIRVALVEPRRRGAHENGSSGKLGLGMTRNVLIPRNGRLLHVS